MASKSEQAYGFLRERIRSRDFDAGHRLVLSTIAEELGMSVVPVREAIRQLESEGLVTYEHNVGARVSLINREMYFETMESVAILEAAATGLSAPHLDDEDIARARALNLEMRGVIDHFDPVAFTRLNQDFHRVLFGKCPNGHLVELVLAEWERLDYARLSTFRFVPERAAESVEEHDRLVDLIEAGAEPGYVELVARRHRLATSESYRAQTHTPTKPE